MPEINEKQVAFHEPAAPLAWKFLPKTVGIERGTSLFEYLSFDEAVELVMGLVESWEFDGDPHDRATYDNLTAGQMLDEFAPLVFEAWNYLIQQLNAGAAASKN